MHYRKWCNRCEIIGKSRVEGSAINNYDEFGAHLKICHAMQLDLCENNQSHEDN